MYRSPNTRVSLSRQWLPDIRMYANETRCEPFQSVPCTHPWHLPDLQTTDFRLLVPREKLPGKNI